MLILRRKVGERIIIGDDPKTAIVITIVETNGQRRVGVDAPKGVRIYRDEIAPLPLLHALDKMYGRVN